MKKTIITSGTLLPVFINAGAVKWTVIGGGAEALQKVEALARHSETLNLTVIATDAEEQLRKFIEDHEQIALVERDYETTDLAQAGLLVAATGNKILNQKIRNEAALQNVLVCVADDPVLSDFNIEIKQAAEPSVVKDEKVAAVSEQRWKRVATRLVIAFFLMVLG